MYKSPLTPKLLVKNMFLDFCTVLSKLTLHEQTHCRPIQFKKRLKWEEGNEREECDAKNKNH
jgi:hypothetical protein